DLDKTKAEEDRTDLYAAPVVKDGSYQFDYYFNLSLGANITDLFNTSLMNRLGEYSAYEKLYRDYVYSVYTKLPQKGLDRLKQDFSSRSPEIKGKSVAEKIDYVRNYLAENTQYSLSPGRLPKGKDFVEYFLYENKIGYCTHYASAATLMLRAMGIPARYVEGYAIGASDIVQNTNPSDQNITMYSDKSRYTIEAPQVEASVKDYNAHAWVEVYIDGSGWIPVEFTPGSAVSNTSKSVEDMTSIGDTIDEKVTPKAEPSVTPTPTQKPEENSQPTVTPVPAGKNRTDNMKPGDSSGQLFKLNAFQILLIVLGFTVIGLTLYILLRIRNKNIEKLTRNHNRKALLLYSEIERMLTSCRSLPGRGERLEDHVDYVKKNCPYLEDEAFDLCMNTVRKARFGKNSITLYELKELEKFHRNLYNDVYQKMPFSKKLYLKLMLLFA
ncbi:MAG TPA: transglutaminase-like domain-containing protein, partial [Mobilitalea sp.]|nr:transglutaminase-like domain-containing protein [Mobilitalea sp.]